MKTFGTARRAKPRVGKRYLTIKDLPEKGIQYHVNHLRRLWRDGRFPVPKHLSPRKLVWEEAEIDAWIETRVS
jgi:predicted DNA-binding transcriptional regulator AlpA